jgi:hypothetical protein
MSDTPPILYCDNHPHVETSLRCNNCNKPICAKCAIPTPTGYRCPECVQGQQKAFETAEWSDYPLTFVIVAVMSLLGAWLTTFLGALVTILAGFIVIFLTPTYAIAIAEIVRKAVHRRRSKRLFQVAAIAAVLGCLPLLLLAIMKTVLGYGGLFSLFPLAWQIIYTFTLTTTVYYRLRGIRT